MVFVTPERPIKHNGLGLVFVCSNQSCEVSSPLCLRFTQWSDDSHESGYGVTDNDCLPLDSIIGNNAYMTG